jgi:hypothetical protein
VGYDGYPDGVAKEICWATSEEEYRELVGRLKELAHFTSPDQGWPWPWPDSQKSSYAYAFHEGRVVFGSGYKGHGWIDAKGYLDHPTSGSPESFEDNKTAIEGFKFPDMTEHQNIARDDRSGLTILRF